MVNSGMPKRRPPRQITLRGKRWKIRDISQLKKWLAGLSPKDRKDYYPDDDLDRLEGLCVYQYKTLWIPVDGDTKEALEIILHEGTHGCTELDEQAVTETARDLAELLWRLGWRRV